MYCKKEFSESQKGAIIAVKKLEHTNTRISEIVDCSRSSVRHVWKSYELKSLLKKRLGCPRILNETECKRLKSLVVRNKKTHHQILSQIRLNFINETNKTIFIQTIQNELAKESFHFQIPCFSPLISESNKEKHYLWARIYKN